MRTKLLCQQRPAAGSTTREGNQYGRTQSSLPQQPRGALPEGVVLPTPCELGSIPGAAIIRSHTFDDAPVRQVVPTFVRATRDAPFQPIHGARQGP